jgi:hypothetical protein
MCYGLSHKPHDGCRATRSRPLIKQIALHRSGLMHIGLKGDIMNISLVQFQLSCRASGGNCSQPSQAQTRSMVSAAKRSQTQPRKSSVTWLTGRPCPERRRWSTIIIFPNRSINERSGGRKDDRQLPEAGQMPPAKRRRNGPAEFFPPAFSSPAQLHLAATQLGQNDRRCGRARRYVRYLGRASSRLVVEPVRGAGIGVKSV